MLSDLCGHFKPCGKDLEVLKDLSTWCHGLVRQPRETAWFDVRSDGNVAHLSAVYCDCWGGGKRREGECYLISLNITLHRVQLHHKKSRKETSWSWTRERTFKRKGLRKRIKSVPCSLICKKNVFCHEELWILLLMRTIATFLASHITATNLCENNK